MATSERASHTKRHTTRTRAARPASERFTKQANAVVKDMQGMGAVAKDALEECQENASVVYEEGQEHVREAKRTLERYIAEQPLTSILIAAGVGLFLGHFWKRH